MKLIDLLEFAAPKNGDDSYKKVMTIIIDFVIKSCKNDGKTKQDISKVLSKNLGHGSDGCNEILEIIKEITEWYDEDPKTLTKQNIQHYLHKFETAYEHACMDAYEWALHEINDKRKADGQVHVDKINPEFNKSHYVAAEGKLDVDDLPTYDDCWKELRKVFPVLSAALDLANKQ
jgi:hypothetical protein